MPTGIQQTLSGLLCMLCDGVISGEPSPAHEEICDACDFDLVRECPTCIDSFFDVSELSNSQIRTLAQRSVPYSYFYYTEDTNESVCENCVCNCEGCGASYQYMDECEGCCRSHSSVIHNYSYRPNPIFYSSSNDVVLGHGRAVRNGSLSELYMGIELEVAKMMDLADEFYERLTSIQKDFVYMKEDGSIGPDGVEIVTMPATLDAFGRLFPFEQLDSARMYGARSYAYQSCGFHIHVSRSAFSATHLWKFVRFQLNNPVLCQRVAQRGENSYASWYYHEDERRDLPDYIKGKKSNGRRYLAINFQNRATIELRYFKGNILKSSILKNLEFVQSMYDYTKTLTVRDVMNEGLTEESYNDWLFVEENMNKYPNLCKFLSADNDSQGE
jgi:hypothetical protein